MFKVLSAISLVILFILAWVVFTGLLHTGWLIGWVLITALIILGLLEVLEDFSILTGAIIIFIIVLILQLFVW